MTPRARLQQHDLCHTRTGALTGILLGCLLWALVGPATAQTPAARVTRVSASQPMGEFANFTQWQSVTEFIDQMVQRNGFNRSQLEVMLRKTQYIDSAIQLMKPAPPGRPKNWQAYRARFVEPVRINAGVTFWNDHAEALARAEAQFGVPAEIIVGIIGVETVYGRNTGNFRVMDAITTLSFAYPNTANRDARMAYFRGELENTLLFARENGIDPFSLYGSYAGAIGLPQFMPGSIRQYAIDFDGNGKIDLRTSAVDSIGSVANFLVQHGWKPGEPAVFPARVQNIVSTSLPVPGTSPDLPLATDASWQKFIAQGLEAKFSVTELSNGGVTPATPLPSDMRFGLVDLQNGTAATEYWLGANNFFVITQYNRSFFYAMSVLELGRAVRVARDLK